MRSYRVCVFSSDLLYLALEVHPCCYKWQDFLLFFLMDKIIFHCTCVLGWPKVSFWYFHKMLQESLNGPFGQPSTLFFFFPLLCGSLVVAPGVSLWRGWGVSCVGEEALLRRRSVLVAHQLGFPVCMRFLTWGSNHCPCPACS